MSDVEVWSQDGERKETREKVKRYPFFPTIRSKKILASYGYEFEKCDDSRSGIFTPPLGQWHVRDKRDGSLVGELRKYTFFGKPTYRVLGNNRVLSNIPSATRTELRDFVDFV